jgi:hypothetical protein
LPGREIWITKELSFAMADPKPPEEEKPDQWWEFCPVCGARLINRKCRFVCSDPKCHFFMSCSEFDL